MQIAQQRSTHTETLADYVLLIVNLVPGLVAESEVTWDERVLRVPEYLFGSFGTAEKSSF